jgi:hypothetical protein
MGHEAAPAREDTQRKGLLRELEGAGLVVEDRARQAPLIKVLLRSVGGGIIGRLFDS